MTAISRGTPTFALPATQNTAPVHEFRCLYTHDIRKKAKKWHDGSAKFHTFNKRVMVYDDTNNYIGDLHYRADEEFGEGVELQLDRGVLVEVGELIGQTQTDLTGVVHKPQRDTPNPSAASASLRSRPPPRVNRSIVEGRPKSLTELLGPSQGRLGRAKLPLTSPFEQRQILSDLQQNERSSKRQKVASGKENRSLFECSPASGPSLRKSSPISSVVTPPTVSRISKQRNLTNKPISTHVANQSHVIDISSDEEVLTKPGPSTGRNNTVNPKTLRTNAQQEHIGTNRGKSSDYKAQNSRREVGTLTRPQQPIANPLKEGSTNANSSLKPGMSLLQMRSQEPRRKLMYKALLPSSETSHGDIAAPVTSQAQAIPNDHEEDHGLNSVAVAVEPPSNGFNDLEELRDCNSGAQSTAVRDRAHETPIEPASLWSITSHSPLFVPQNASQRSPTPVRNFVENALDIGGTQDILNDNTAANDMADLPLLMETDEATNVEPDSPCFPFPPSRAQTAQQLSPTTIPSPRFSSKPPPTQNCPEPVQCTPPPVRNRSLARSLSTNDSPFPHDPRASPVSRPKLNSVEESPHIAQHRTPLAASLIPNSTLLNDKRTPTKSPFQRCRSDTAAIIPTVVATTVVPPAIPTAEEQGPWTTLEAFLLFDQWPMCKRKDKPVFEPLSTQEAGDQDGGSSSSSSSGDEGMTGFISAAAVRRNGPSVLIRSARALLRDAQACRDGSVRG